MVNGLIIKRNIYAVIVTFNPDIGNVKCLVSELLKQDVTPVIVDNGSLSKEESSNFSSLCTLIALDNNFGIAKAQNEGVLFAKNSGAEHVVFFDQDSHITAGFIDNLVSDYVDLLNRNIVVGAVGPVFIDSRYKFYYKQIILSKLGVRRKINPELIKKPFEVTLIISSGSLISIVALEDVGGMDEDLFIDYVDTEWCLRAISKGYKIYVSTSASMEHAIGDKMISFLGLHIPVHSPVRRYYRIRNAILLLRMSHVPIVLKLRDNIMNFIHQIILIITQKNKIKNISIMFSAIKDGISGVKGKMS